MKLNCVHIFLATLIIFIDLFCFFGHLLDLFELVSPVMCAEIPLCKENSAILMRVRGKPYYARRTPKFSAQSCYYAGHIRHNMYFFQSGLGWFCCNKLADSFWWIWYAVWIIVNPICPKYFAMIESPQRPRFVLESDKSSSIISSWKFAYFKTRKG